MEVNPILLLGLISFIFNACLAIYVFISNRQAAKDRELQDAKERITKVEERVRNLPDHQAVASMTGDMKALRAEVAGLKDVISPLARAMDRVNDYLLNHKDK